MLLRPEHLEQAAQLLEKGWSRKSWARDKRGGVVSPYDERACQFCAEGAVYRAVLGMQGDISDVRENEISRELLLLTATAGWSRTIITENDLARDPAAVVEKLRSLIPVLEKMLDENGAN